MKNYEKYADEIREYKGDSICADFVEPYILKSINAKCTNISCVKCHLYRTIWLMEDYEEPEVDWSKVEVNTPILVRHDECDKWSYRYFAKYENGVVYAWHCGCPNWAKDCMVRWEYAKLAKSEDKCEKPSEEEPETDWSKVAVDTPILVKNYVSDKWQKRHFAKYENGIVYAWNNGETSWTTVAMTDWKYAKLAESEIDWSKVEVDTAIYVKASKYGNWFKRHFAEYKNGKIYTWGNGLTSHDTSRMMEWNYAKLAESEETK